MLLVQFLIPLRSGWVEVLCCLTREQPLVSDVDHLSFRRRTLVLTIEVLVPLRVCALTDLGTAVLVWHESHTTGLLLEIGQLTGVVVGYGRDFSLLGLIELARLQLGRGCAVCLECRGGSGCWRWLRGWLRDNVVVLIYPHHRTRWIRIHLYQIRRPWSSLLDTWELVIDHDHVLGDLIDHLLGFRCGHALSYSLLHELLPRAVERLHACSGTTSEHTV